MKRPYTLLLGLTATYAMAQAPWTNRPLHPEEKHGYHVPAVKGERGTPKGSAYYTESFDTDLNGWTVTSDVGDVVWHWTNTGPGPTASTYPVPALNTTTGWAIFDDDYEGSSNQLNESSLVSPVIDLSQAPANLRLVFDQYYQVFTETTVDVWVGVSTDGGNNWSETLVNDGVGRDGRPNPELFDLDISAQVAPDPSNVQIRFHYSGTWDYGWQVDNIAIEDLPNNDMALMLARNTLFDFAGTGADAQPYTIYPQEHLVMMEPNGQMKNKGFLAQNNVSATMSITGPGGDDFTSTSAATGVLPGELVDIFFDPFQPNGTIGTYNVSYTVTQDEVDEIPDNNTKLGSFAVSANVYALDQGAVDRYQRQAPDALDQTFEVGSKFQFQIDDQVTAVQVAIHDGTPAGGLVYGAVYDLSTTDTEHPSLRGDYTTEHAIDASELNAVGGTTFITMPFVNPIDVFAGETVQVMAGAFEPADSVYFATSGIVPSQIALIHYPNRATDFEFTFTKAPMVRAVLASGSIGIAEEGGLVNVVRTGPNPFTDGCDLRFELARGARVRVELHDATGRAVLGEDLGELGAGQQRYRIDGSALSEGIYLYTVSIGGVRYNGKITRTH